MAEVTVTGRNTVILVSELEKTETGCDRCPRTARYKVADWESDEYLCKRHTVRRMGDALIGIETKRYVA